MRYVVNNSSINYLGGDIVINLINNNQKSNLGNNNLNFIHFDICKDKIPDNMEFIFIRDLFVHFSYADIKTALNNIKNHSNVKYIMMTTFINRTNSELPIQWPWRPLCFFKEPFNFPKPIELINEICSEDYPNNIDKSLGLWKVEDINTNF
jgi:hypothetical protein